MRDRNTVPANIFEKAYENYAMGPTREAYIDGRMESIEDAIKFAKWIVEHRAIYYSIPDDKWTSSQPKRGWYIGTMDVDPMTTQQLYQIYHETHKKLQSAIQISREEESTYQG